MTDRDLRLEQVECALADIILRQNKLHRRLTTRLDALSVRQDQVEKRVSGATATALAGLNARIQRLEQSLERIRKADA